VPHLLSTFNTLNGLNAVKPQVPANLSLEP
jgi:hypothetical protein